MRSQAFLTGAFLSTLFVVPLAYAWTGAQRAPSSDPRKDFASLLHDAAECDVRTHDQAAVLFGYSHEFEPDLPLVLVEQAGILNHVLILVHDPSASGQTRVRVKVTEFYPGTSGYNDSHCPRRKPLHSHTWSITLAAAHSDSGTFIGRADISGSHGTQVIAEYRRGPTQGCLCADTAMAFH